MRLKICGVRTSEMLAACTAAGVDFVGFNFVPTSKRRVERPVLDEFFIKQRPVSSVAVFMDQPLSEGLEILNAYPFDIVQLHGNENIDYIRSIKSTFPGIKIWKAISVKDDFEISTLEQYQGVIDAFLFDGPNPGSGVGMETKHAPSLREALNFCTSHEIPFGIAGGINAENIAVFRDQFPKADFLDTASGVEENGAFSIEKLQALVHNLRV